MNIDEEDDKELSDKAKEVRLTRLAAELRSAYKRKRSIVDRREYKPHKRFDGIEAWKKAAALCSRLKADPLEFIDAQFKYRQGPVFANTLGGPIAEKAYRQYTASASLPAVKAESTSPSSVLLMSRIAELWAHVQDKLGEPSPSLSAAVEVVLSTPWHYDALAAMLVLGFDPRVKDEFSKMAAEELDRELSLKLAAKKLGLSLEYIYDEQH